MAEVSVAEQLAYDALPEETRSLVERVLTDKIEGEVTQGLTTEDEILIEELELEKHTMKEAAKRALELADEIAQTEDSQNMAALDEIREKLREIIAE